MAIKYAKTQTDKLNKPLISDLTVLQKEKDSVIKEKSNKLLDEESRVDTFIKRLKTNQYRSHLLIRKSSTIEEVRRILPERTNPSILLERCKGSVELLDFTSKASQQD